MWHDEDHPEPLWKSILAGACFALILAVWVLSCAVLG